MASVYALLSEFPSTHAVTSAHPTRLTNLLFENFKGRYGRYTAVMFRETAKKLNRFKYASKVSGTKAHH